MGAPPHGQSLCGTTMDQGALPPGTPVTCAACLERLPDYERALANDGPPEQT